MTALPEGKAVRMSSSSSWDAYGRALRALRPEKPAVFMGSGPAPNFEDTRTGRTSRHVGQPRGLRGAAQNAALALLSCTLALACIEAGLRAWGPNDLETAKLDPLHTFD